MIYCYIDESGNPSPKDGEPFYVAMIVVLSLREVERIQRAIKMFRLKNNIAQEYEFHYSRNASKRRKLFLGFIVENIGKY